MADNALVPADRIARSILVIRGQPVMLDQDLAELYGVETRLLVRTVKRNLERFPADFMLQLTEQEWEPLRIRSGISKGRGGRRYLPYGFTEHGVAMLSSVLRSPRAVQVNIEIMRAFVRARALRAVLASDKDLARRVTELEKKTKLHDLHFEAISYAMRKAVGPKPPLPPKPRIGFKPDPGKKQ